MFLNGRLNSDIFVKKSLKHLEFCKRDKKRGEKGSY